MTTTVLDAGPWRRAALVPPGTNGRWPWESGVSWFWLLLALLAAIIGSLVWAIPHFEQRLDTSVRRDLSSAGIDTDNLKFNWDYRNLVVSGRLPPGVSVDQFVDVLSSSDNAGIRNLKMVNVAETPTFTGIESRPEAVADAAQDLSIEQMPFVPATIAVDARSDGDTVTLSGTVATTRQRDQLVNAALGAPGIENINDNLDIAMSVEALTDADIARSDARIAAMSDLLALSGSDDVVYAELAMNEEELSYDIQAVDDQSAQAIEKAAGVTLIDFQVVGEVDYIKRGEIDTVVKADNGQLTLTGSVLTEQQRRQLQFAAIEAVGQERVDDQLTVSGLQARLPGSDDRIANLAALIGQFAVVETGQAVLRGNDLNLDVSVPEESNAVELHRLARSARELGISTVEQIAVLENEVAVSIEEQVSLLQAELDDLAEEIQASVVFDSGATELSARAAATLLSLIHI